MPISNKFQLGKMSNGLTVWFDRSRNKYGPAEYLISLGKIEETKQRTVTYFSTNKYDHSVCSYLEVFFKFSQDAQLAPNYPPFRGNCVP